MTRPQIIRADTIDLQDSDAPSAKDHTRQPTQPGALGVGPHSPHQASELKRAEESYVGERRHSPRVSQDFESPEYQSGISALQNGTIAENTYQEGNAPNGGAQQIDGDMSDDEGDDGLDDDMLDKISSSPSIDDGGYYFYRKRPACLESIGWSSRRMPQREAEPLSSSPFLEVPAHFPLGVPSSVPSTGTSRRNEYFGDADGSVETPLDAAAAEAEAGDEERDVVTPLVSSPRKKPLVGRTLVDSDSEGSTTAGLHDFLLPSDDSMLSMAPPKSQLSGLQDTSPKHVDEGIDIEESDGDLISDLEDQFSFVERDQYIDSGWGGECLRETEDIDFEFVYALRTFVATVEGQANATKGDTMVLLDDSNSYWWLVRVVKDSSIGYLPAEHIETPTERLARLNKHRNIDLSATMLSDNVEKSKNPLKIAMRRRNAKTVQFTAPTYHEASDNNYSSSEEDDDDIQGLENGQQSHLDTNTSSSEEGDQSATVEPLKVRSQGKANKSDPSAQGQDSQSAEAKAIAAESSDPENEVGSKERKSKNGTVRNTDSFFKDDSVETRKISLTPKLLSDDSTGSPVKGGEAREAQSVRADSGRLANAKQAPTTRASIESQEKPVTLEKPKEEKRDKKKEKKEKEKEKKGEKKDKEKKPGMLSGFFKRNKDKRPRQSQQDTDIDDDSIAEKTSVDSSRASPVSKASEESSPLEPQAPSSLSQGVQSSRPPSKLQKPPPLDLSIAKRAHQGSPAPEIQPQVQQAVPERPAGASPDHQATVVSRGISSSVQDDSPSSNILAPSISRETVQSDKSPTSLDENEPKKEPHTGGGILAPITNMLKSSTSSPSESKPEKVKKAKHRVELDDFDSSPDDDRPPPSDLSPVGTAARHGDASAASEPFRDPDTTHRHLSESPTQLHSSPPVTTITTSRPPISSPAPPSKPTTAIPTDLSSQEDSSALSRQSTSSPTTGISPPSSPDEPVSSSPAVPIAHSTPTSKSLTSTSPSSSPITHTATKAHPQAQTPPSSSTTTGSSSATPTPSWSDASLRAYFDDDHHSGSGNNAGAEIRDLLIVVHDRTGVVPVGDEHPLMKGLVGEKGRLRDMEVRLDGLLKGWLDGRAGQKAAVVGKTEG